VAASTNARLLCVATALLTTIALGLAVGLSVAGDDPNALWETS
jgi:hypothetical protein